MAEPQDESRTPGARASSVRKGRWVLFTSMAAAVISLVVAAVVISWVRRGEMACARHGRELLAEAGAALASRPRVPDEANAAPLYALAFALFVDPGNPVYGSQPYAARDFADAGTARHLADNAGYLAAIRLAQGRTQCDFRPDWAMGVDMRLSHLSPLRHMVVFLCVAARHEAQMGHPDEALDRLSMALRAAGDVGDDCLLCRMSRNSQEKMLVQTLEAVLNESDPGAMALAKFATDLERSCRERPRLAAAVRASRAVVSYTLAELLSGRRSTASLTDSPERKAPGLCERVWCLSGRTSGELRLYTRYMDDAADAAESPYPECLDAIKELDVRLERIFVAAPDDHVLVRKMMGSGGVFGDRSVLLATAESDASADACLKTAWLALGCRLHKQKTGRWPESLADLPTALPGHFRELPRDPFSGRDFVYRRTSAGCLIYSVGRNRQDDGGVPWRSLPSGGDLPLELKR